MQVMACIFNISRIYYLHCKYDMISEVLELRALLINVLNVLGKESISNGSRFTVVDLPLHKLCKYDLLGEYFCENTHN